MTRRQQIIEILQQNKQTAQQLANYFQTELKEIIEDLQHVEMSKTLRTKVRSVFLSMLGNQSVVSEFARAHSHSTACFELKYESVRLCDFRHIKIYYRLNLHLSVKIPLFYISL